MKTFKLVVGVFLLTLLTTVNFNAMGQPGDPPDPGDDPVPLTGLEFLLIGGGILGGYKAFKKRNDQDQDSSL